MRKEFDALRGRVIAAVRARLGAGGATLDASDLEACYAQAWHGLYAAVLDGQQIANPAGWLTLVTFRRAIEELRARRRIHPGGALGSHGPWEGRAGVVNAQDGVDDPDLASELDDRIRLRQLLEGLRGRLSAREREAAALCYLQGLSRSQAAARMGISESRMRKLMDGQGPGRPGVAGKVEQLAETIRAGAWCEEQGSLMRGLAYGILDPNGERYRLALIHRSECPACRAYVLSLRGLAAALPPVLLPWGLGAEVLTRAGVAAHAGAGIGAGAGAGGQGGAALGAAGAQGGAGAGGALSASGAAGVGGAAGGSWLWAGGPLGAKVAVGCLLALGVGAGCVAFTGGLAPRAPVHTRDLARGHPPLPGGAYGAGGSRAAEDRLAEGTLGALHRNVSAGGRPGVGTAGLPAAARAAREFGPEQAGAPGAYGSVSLAGAHPYSPRSASPQAEAPATAQASGVASTSGTKSAARAPSDEGAGVNGPGTGRPAAEREFGIG